MALKLPGGPVCPEPKHWSSGSHPTAAVQTHGSSPHGVRPQLGAGRTGCPWWGTWTQSMLGGKLGAAPPDVVCAPLPIRGGGRAYHRAGCATRSQWLGRGGP